MMKPMNDAPNDGTPVLVKVKEDLSEFGVSSDGIGDTYLFCGLHAVMQSYGDIRGWSYVGPLGRGGFPDEWLEGWWPLPEE